MTLQQCNWNHARSLQLEPRCKWNHAAAGTTLQLCKWNHAATGTTLQLEPRCSWNHAATGTMLERSLQVEPQLIITPQVSLDRLQQGKQFCMDHRSTGRIQCNHFNFNREQAPKIKGNKSANTRSLLTSKNCKHNC